MQIFKLVPFPVDNLPNISISGELNRSGSIFSLRYKVTGEINQLLLSAKSAFPSRTSDLWKATCFEFFIAITNQPEYWEFNMSPSKDWNVYKMDAYRRVGFREEAAFTQLPFLLEVTDSTLTLDISADLSPIFQPEQKVQVGVTAIIQTVHDNETFWALAHPSKEADFHLREGFLLTV